MVVTQVDAIFPCSIRACGHLRVILWPLSSSSVDLLDLIPE
jgi:hypothetical protein